MGHAHLALCFSLAYQLWLILVFISDRDEEMALEMRPRSGERDHARKKQKVRTHKMSEAVAQEAAAWEVGELGRTSYAASRAKTHDLYGVDRSELQEELEGTERCLAKSQCLLKESRGKFRSMEDQLLVSSRDVSTAQEKAEKAEEALAKETQVALEKDKRIIMKYKC
ncbi:hypothetical protein B296_00005304 [Ensete ventricosum]|uniref:Uncharacterized protein n=1 Tax=Ensete ventricosum TaxID=4639 RepID=A0A427AV84_ENSVE|nr:hypothetical protein B296_00005304 [Ensete ventricosum]